jgi:hypothetical protein
LSIVKDFFRREAKLMMVWLFAVPAVLIVLALVVGIVLSSRG